MSKDITRKLIVDGLIKVENSGFSNLVLPSIINDKNLTSQDRDFITRVFYGTIERKITLNYILQKYIQKPVSKLDEDVRAIMQSGLYQVLYMNSVPRYAAINQAVGLCQTFRKTSARGLVNAVLRKAAEFDINDEKFISETEKLSVVYSVSEEIVELILKDYPEEAEIILQGMFLTPILTINVNETKIKTEDFCHLLDDNGIIYKRMPARHLLEIRTHGDIKKLPGFSEGFFFVQGLTSAFAVQSAGIKKGDRVLDLCAAPGGKTFAADIELGNSGSIVSCDPNESRLELIKSGAERLGFTNISTLKNLGQVYNPELVGKDVVICDVPCSGIGIIPKKPDLRYKKMDDLTQLCELQGQILATASKYVKSGGKITYSTCTINKDENERQIRKFLSENPEFCTVEIDNVPEGAIIDDNMITFLPSHPLCDGFFIAVLEKI